MSLLVRFAAHPPAWIGRRGSTLVLMGLVWILIGIRIPMTEGPIPEVWALAHVALGQPVRITLWITTGALAILGATIERPRWEQAGFVALIICPTIRVGSYGSSWAASIFTDYGYPHAWSTALTWLLACLFILILAGWPEETRTNRVLIAETDL